MGWAPRGAEGWLSLGSSTVGRKELVGVEVADHLLRHLGQDALGQRFLGSVLELSERHELDDVSDGRLARRGAQTAPVTVEKLHGTEVGTAHPDDDDGHGQLGGINQSLSGLVEVRDHTVGDDEEHKILLPRKEGRPLSRCNSEQ